MSNSYDTYLLLTRLTATEKENETLRKIISALRYKLEELTGLSQSAIDALIKNETT
jgi:hypothetical protein